MTHSDFNQLLSSIKALTQEQVRQLRQQLDRRGCDRASAKDFHEIRAVFTRGVA